uniref:Ovule protein n=1 Tax=Haemonchus contortus TaxID=6289 RepID=A0A7I4YLP1_HAECO
QGKSPSVFRFIFHNDYSCLLNAFILQEDWNIGGFSLEDACQLVQYLLLAASLTSGGPWNTEVKKSNRCQNEGLR